MHELSPKTKHHFSETESEVLRMCNMDVDNPPTAVELAHSNDYNLQTKISSYHLTPSVSKENTDEIQKMREL